MRLSDALYFPGIDPETQLLDPDRSLMYEIEDACPLLPGAVWRYWEKAGLSHVELTRLGAGEPERGEVTAETFETEEGRYVFMKALRGVSAAASAPELPLENRIQITINAALPHIETVLPAAIQADHRDRSYLALHGGHFVTVDYLPSRDDARVFGTNQAALHLHMAAGGAKLIPGDFHGETVKEGRDAEGRLTLTCIYPLPGRVFADREKLHVLAARLSPLAHQVCAGLDKTLSMPARKAFAILNRGARDFMTGWAQARRVLDVTDIFSGEFPMPVTAETSDAEIHKLALDLVHRAAQEKAFLSYHDAVLALQDHRDTEQAVASMKGHAKAQPVSALLQDLEDLSLDVEPRKPLVH